MAASLFFYDLETSGTNPRAARVMQFAGQRTDLQLKPIGQPVNVLIKLTDDVLPDPEAILITGITPQQARADGLTEAEFLQLFTAEVATPDTVFVGFNSIRFDDEFMRFLHYRNFYDPYEWQWQEGRSRWDLLDVVRMTRALRPDGIQWPVDSDGKPSNRLQLLTGINKLDHQNAHDALADVQATIAVARLIYNKQTKLFEYLLNVRQKAKVADLVNDGQPFVYTSGKYPSELQKTTVVIKLADHPKKQGALVYDLRHDPSVYLQKSAQELAALWRYNRDPTADRLPIKTLQYNRCPAVAPMGVFDQAAQTRLRLDLQTIQAHRQKLKGQKAFVKRVLAALDLLNEEQQTRLLAQPADVDAQLYEGFFATPDKITMQAVRAAEPDDLTGFIDQFKDVRLKALLPLYKARNFPRALSQTERAAWEQFCRQRLTAGGEQSRLHGYFGRLEELAASAKLSASQRFLLEELRLYGESLMPDPTGAG